MAAPNFFPQRIPYTEAAQAMRQNHDDHRPSRQDLQRRNSNPEKGLRDHGEKTFLAHATSEGVEEMPPRSRIGQGKAEQSGQSPELARDALP